MIRGLRPLPFKQLTLPPNLSRKTIEKMRRILFDETLVNGKTREDFTQQQLYVVDHAVLVILFHRGEKTADDIWVDHEEGHQVGFNQEEIDSLNFVILEEREKGQLESIFQKLKEKSQK